MPTWTLEELEAARSTCRPTDAEFAGSEFHDASNQRVVEGAIGSLRDEATRAITGIHVLKRIGDICQHAFGRHVSSALNESIFHDRVHVESHLTGDARVARRAAIDRAAWDDVNSIPLPFRLDRMHLEFASVHVVGWSQSHEETIAFLDLCSRRPHMDILREQIFGPFALERMSSNVPTASIRMVGAATTAGSPTSAPAVAHRLIERECDRI
jgi:hypothetical protein